MSVSVEILTFGRKNGFGNIRYTYCCTFDAVAAATVQPTCSTKHFMLHAAHSTHVEERSEPQVIG